MCVVSFEKTFSTTSSPSSGRIEQTAYTTLSPCFNALRSISVCIILIFCGILESLKIIFIAGSFEIAPLLLQVASTSIASAFLLRAIFVLSASTSSILDVSTPYLFKSIFIASSLLLDKSNATTLALFSVSCIMRDVLMPGAAAKSYISISGFGSRASTVKTLALS